MDSETSAAVTGQRNSLWQRWFAPKTDAGSIGNVVDGASIHTSNRDGRSRRIGPKKEGRLHAKAAFFISPRFNRISGYSGNRPSAIFG